MTSPPPKRGLRQVAAWFHLTEAEVFWLSLVAAIFLLGLAVLAWRARDRPVPEPAPRTQSRVTAPGSSASCLRRVLL